jgi:hypothetical protein
MKTIYYRLCAAWYILLGRRVIYGVEFILSKPIIIVASKEKKTDIIGCHFRSVDGFEGPSIQIVEWPEYKTVQEISENS